MSAFPFDFRMRAPEGRLGRAVASVWFARGTIPYRRERVAPTGSTVAVIVLGDAIVETSGGPHPVAVRTETGFLIGPHDRPVLNAPTGETFAVGIVTTPVGCRAALGLDPAVIAGAVLELVPAWAPADGLRRELTEATDPQAMLDIVTGHLERALDLEIPGLDRCEAAVRLLEADPLRPIGDIASELRVSHGHLDREFTRIVGLSPRRLARLLRVERLLAAIDPAGEPRWADLAAAFGWADQSHLIRDVKRHTGVTPSAYLAARRSFLPDQGSPEAARFVPETM